jgi:hypothetical protein
VDDLISYSLRPGMTFYAIDYDNVEETTKTDAKNYFV